MGGAPAPGTVLRRVSGRSMEDDAPVIYGLEFQVGRRKAPRVPQCAERGRRGSAVPRAAGGPAAAGLQDLLMQDRSRPCGHQRVLRDQPGPA